MLSKLYANHKNIWKDKDFALSVVLGFLFLLFSFVINYFAGSYANSSQSNYVSDIFLDHLPFYNLNIVFFEGFFLFWFSIIIILAYKPRTIPFTLKSIALFILIRSLFITLTHLRDYPNQAFLEAESVFKNFFTFGGDLFFSAHTGLPFLMALAFWQFKKLRIFYLFVTVIFAASMLLGHLHYSIDVFGAFFITYSIYKMAQYFFAEDYRHFLTEQV